MGWGNHCLSYQKMGSFSRMVFIIYLQGGHTCLPYCTYTLHTDVGLCAEPTAALLRIRFRAHGFLFLHDMCLPLYLNVNCIPGSQVSAPKLKIFSITRCRETNKYQTPYDIALPLAAR